MAKEAQKQDQDPAKAPWNDIGAAFQRAGVPLDLAQAVDPLDLELPLEGGLGVAPSDVEARRRTAAIIRKLYDDMFDYRVEDEVQALGEDAAAAEAPPAEPEPVTVQAFDRKTGAPIKVKVNMAPPAR